MSFFEEVHLAVEGQYDACLGAKIGHGGMLQIRRENNNLPFLRGEVPCAGGIEVSRTCIQILVGTVAGIIKTVYAVTFFNATFACLQVINTAPGAVWM